jgi:hypothetical protein
MNPFHVSWLKISVEISVEIERHGLIPGKLPPVGFQEYIPTLPGFHLEYGEELEDIFRSHQLFKKKKSSQLDREEGYIIEPTFSSEEGLEEV